MLGRVWSELRARKRGSCEANRLYTGVNEVIFLWVTSLSSEVSSSLFDNQFSEADVPQASTERAHSKRRR